MYMNNKYKLIYNTLMNITYTDKQINETSKMIINNIIGKSKLKPSFLRIHIPLEESVKRQHIINRHNNKTYRRIRKNTR